MHPKAEVLVYFNVVVTPKQHLELNLTKAIAAPSIVFAPMPKNLWGILNRDHPHGLSSHFWEIVWILNFTRLSVPSSFGENTCKLFPIECKKSFEKIFGNHFMFQQVGQCDTFGILEYTSFWYRQLAYSIPKVVVLHYQIRMEVSCM